MDLDKVQFGYFVDPNEGMKGVMMIQGGGKYEYPITEGGMQQIVMSLSPEEQTRFSFYNQAIQSSQKNYGKGKVQLGTEQNPFEFNFEETPSKIDPTKKSYTYMDELGITRRANTIQEMQNNITRVYDGVKAIETNPAVKAKIKYIQQQTIAGKYTPEQSQKLIMEAVNDARKVAEASKGSLGKPVPQSKDPLGLGI
jgi:hypothetical protein